MSYLKEILKIIKVSWLKLCLKEFHFSIKGDLVRWPKTGLKVYCWDKISAIIWKESLLKGTLLHHPDEFLDRNLKKHEKFPG